MVHCEKLQLAAGTFEPFFCTATLYDITKKVRVSKTWHFDVNSPDVMGLLGTKVVRTSNYFLFFWKSQLITLFSKLGEKSYYISS